MRLHINCDIDEGGRRRREEVRFSQRWRRESEDDGRRSQRRRVDDAPGRQPAYNHSRNGVGERSLRRSPCITFYTSYIIPLSHKSGELWACNCLRTCTFPIIL